DRRGGIELGDLHHVDELEELLHDLLERRRFDVGHDRDATEPRILAGRDSEREDVVATPGEQRRHARQHAGPVLDEHGEDVMVGGHERVLQSWSKPPREAPATPGSPAKPSVSLGWYRRSRAEASEAKTSETMDTFAISATAPSTARKRGLCRRSTAL